MPTIHCYFENKAAAACATSALNKFCSICTAFRCLHRIWDRPHGEGIEGIRVSPHTCRHFYAQQQIKMGTDLYTISRLLGHENIQITQTYLNSLRDEEVINISKQRSVLLSM